VPVWIINIFSDAEIWEFLEHLMLGLVGIILSTGIILEARLSSKEGKPCSTSIEQLSFAFTPNKESDTPYKRMEYFGYLSLIASVIIFITTILRNIG
jgi:hypothetical protein